MRYDTTFTNGVIKARERSLLGDKILRMAESERDEAFRILLESGFGGETPVDSPAQAEVLIRAEEAAVNEFIRTYAPDEKMKAFLLAEYDFHNAEGYVKCRYAGADEAKIISEDGLFPAAFVGKAVYSGELSGLPAEMKEAIEGAQALFNEGKANGFEIDCLFKRKLFSYKKRLAKDKHLKAILCASADAANVSSALRSRDAALAEKMFVEGGKLPKTRIIGLCELSFESIAAGEYSNEIKLAAKAAAEGLPLTEFEKAADETPLGILEPVRYDMLGAHPFLYYIMRRRAEIRNVRIVTVSLAAGLSDAAIKNKLRNIDR